VFGSVVGPTVKAIKKFDRTGDVIKGLRTMASRQVLIGIPESESARQGGGVTNAQLAFLHEHGFNAPKWPMLAAYKQRAGANKKKVKAIAALQAYLMSKGDPYWHVPARPFLEPSIEANLPQIIAQQKKIILAALDGKAALVKMEQQKLGMLGQSLAKGWFVDPRNHWAPNHPLIVAIKGSDKPLIDTGQLRNSITYVVKDRNAHA
jgi:hypothetical protein